MCMRNSSITLLLSWMFENKFLKFSISIIFDILKLSFSRETSVSLNFFLCEILSSIPQNEFKFQENNAGERAPQWPR